MTERLMFAYLLIAAMLLAIAVGVARWCLQRRNDQRRRSGLAMYKHPDSARAR